MQLTRRVARKYPREKLTLESNVRLPGREEEGEMDLSLARGQMTVRDSEAAGTDSARKDMFRRRKSCKVLREGLADEIVE
jgi:hypothetical protein